MPELLDNLDVFYGELTPARATIYARLEGLKNTDGLSLSGYVRGPRCFYSKTLPATFRLQDAGPGPSLLSKSLVPDPSYWSPETPHTYDVTVELRKGTDIIASDVRQIGFKPLGISGRSFTWEGKPWVLRGVTDQTADANSIATWQDRSNSLIFLDPPLDEQLRVASERGILVWVALPLMARTPLLVDAMIAFGQWPCLAGFLIAAKGQYDKVPEDLLNVVPNALKGLYPGNRASIDPSQVERIFHHVMSGTAGDVDFDALNPFPLVIIRAPRTAPGKKPAYISVKEGRRIADRMQAELAPRGQFAGYVA
jgi:hypothetical protein